MLDIIFDVELARIFTHLTQLHIKDTSFSVNIRIANKAVKLSFLLNSTLSCLIEKSLAGFFAQKICLTR